jgi:hypothetical protein
MPMPYYTFIWTDVAQSKVEANGVTLDDFEDVVCHPLSPATSRSTGRPMAFGWNSEGKMIACVYEKVDELQILPITAYEVDDE